jgi:AraC-like DNA-binding protein
LSILPSIIIYTQKHRKRAYTELPKNCLIISFIIMHYVKMGKYIILFIDERSEVVTVPARTARFERVRKRSVLCHLLGDTMIDHNDLVNTLLRHAPKTGNFPTDIKGFTIIRRDEPNNIERCILQPIFLMPVQGSKRIVVGKKTYEYCVGQSFFIGMDLPGDGMVIEASPKKPYLSMIVDLDTTLLMEISAELPKKSIGKQTMLAIACTKTDPAVLEGYIRLVDLLDKPEHIRFLAPMIIREIHYRLLTGPLGTHIRAINTSGTHSNKIGNAIKWVEKNYKITFVVEELAERVNMPVSTFHRNFKALTELSPLQFQKKLRLLEARRLMLIERFDVTNACYDVGYESPTQFNREYKRMFGDPPLHDIKNILQQTNGK